MNRQKKIRQKLIKKAKAANAKANPKKRSEYVAKAEREKAKAEPASPIG
ncbi:DUF2986 domain-containing protein [Eionea flava]